jgi:hypothetical protein
MTNSRYSVCFPASVAGSGAERALQSSMGETKNELIPNVVFV